MEILAYTAIAFVIYFGITAIVIGLCRAASDADDEILGSLQYSDDLEQHVQHLKSAPGEIAREAPIPVMLAPARKKRTQPAPKRRQRVSQAKAV